MNGKLPYNDDCIIYNDFGTGVSRRAIKHFIPHVWWREKKAINVIQMGVTTANSVEVMATRRDGFMEPRDWQQLTIEEALSGKYYTLQENDRMIKGNPLDAPLTFTSTVQVDQFFGAAHSHTVMSVDEKKLPGGETFSFEIGCK